MTSEEVLALFREAGGLLEGHFLYASGRHGRQFLQAARVLQYPWHCERMCKAMADQFRDASVELVIGPATGGIVLAHETGRHLEVRAAFTEKDGKGGMALKRGFALKPKTRVLVVEDVTTTGGSIQKTVDHLRGRGAEIVGVSVLIDRSGGTISFDCPYEPLATIKMESWEAGDCPLCADGVTIIDPDNIVV
jgi:orotate phosphoribosyltransferase